MSAEKLKLKIKFSKTAEKNLAGILAILLVGVFYYPQWHAVIAAKAITVDANTAAQSQLPSQSTQPIQSVQILSPQDIAPQTKLPKIEAKEVLVFDATSKQNLFSNNPNQQVEIASLTKLMTAVVAIKNPNFKKPITITKNDQLNIEPVLHLQAGDRVMPEDLLKAMLVGSANDAALTLANHFPDYQTFIETMNLQAALLGMNNTHYSTAIGFDDPQNYSTATDLKKLVNYAVPILPYKQIWQNQSFAFTSLNGTKYKIENSNFLVSNHPNIKSIKTGLTPEAQGNMIVLAANQFGDKIISIVLNSAEREKDTLAVINYVFKKFSWKG